jgi:hypothetical protein
MMAAIMRHLLMAFPMVISLPYFCSSPVCGYFQTFHIQEALLTIERSADKCKKDGL